MLYLTKKELPYNIFYEIDGEKKAPSVFVLVMIDRSLILDVM